MNSRELLIKKVKKVIVFCVDTIGKSEDTIGNWTGIFRKRKKRKKVDTWLSRLLRNSRIVLGIGENFSTKN